MRWAACGFWLVLFGIVGCKRPAPNPPPQVSVSAVPSASVGAAPAKALGALAAFVAGDGRGAVWVQGSMLGVFEFGSRANTIVVSEPYGEPIACAAASPDRELLVAAASARSRPWH